jgi:hypothetical protein
MNWLVRLGFIAFGLLVIDLAIAQLRTGRFVFDNASYHQTTFAAGGIGVGFVLILLAFLPPSRWVYKRISTKKQIMPKHPNRRHSGLDSN